MTDSVVEKLELKFENALGNPVEGLLSLLNALDQPCSCTHFLLEVLACLFFCRPFLAYHAPVKRTYPQTRHTVVVKVDDVFVTDFFHKDVGQNSKSFLLTETTRWLRLKRCDHMSSVCDFIHGNTQLASHLFVTFGF